MLCGVIFEFFCHIENEILKLFLSVTLFELLMKFVVIFYRSYMRERSNLMRREDIIRKLTSRKFWMAVASFVSMLMIYSGAEKASAEGVAAIIMAGASVVAYVLGEGLADSQDGTIYLSDVNDVEGDE